MPITAGLSYAAFYFALILAAVVFFRDRRSFVHQVFAVGMGLLALEELFRGLGYQAIMPEDVIYWQKRQMAAASLLPGTWLAFSLTYARSEYKSFLARWKWVVLALFAFATALVIVFRRSMFTGSVDLEGAGRWGLELGWAGQAFNVVFILSSVLILLNLERTLRASTGRMRWQIKFMVLGVSGLFALRIYFCSQALVYSKLDTEWGAVNAVALIAANVLFIRSLLRTQSLTVNVYLSSATIQRSLTILLAGIYLIAVGFLAHLARYFQPSRSLPLDAFVVFLALTGLAILLLSDRLRQRLRRFVSRHFRRPVHDYRQIWMNLTERTKAMLDDRQLATAVARMASESLEILSVNIWLLSEDARSLTLAGSTVFSAGEAKKLEKAGGSAYGIIQHLRERPEPIDLRKTPLPWAEEIMSALPNHFAEARMRHAIPLSASGQLLGVMTLNEDRVGGDPLSIEDVALLQALAAQLSASLLNLKLAEGLRQAKEIEAFQQLSTFFVHDLKNLASRLSLTLQNLPKHFDNPEFRADALRVISQSLEKINDMCSRLSLVRQRVELHPVQTDLNELLRATLAELNHTLDVPLETDLQPLREVQIDTEQIHKVITNLVLNANEALDGNGSIRVSTQQGENRVIFTIKDNGCGMDDEFIEKSLFRPFQTTKKKGLGIGLFHSKMIVEAHGGRIEVESTVGKGSEFRVVLPA